MPESTRVRPNATVAQDRRDTSPEGIARRTRFEASLERLRALGLSTKSVEYYRHLARKTRRLPHELVCDLADDAARGQFLPSS
jgi:hypothetical protein